MVNPAPGLHNRRLGPVWGPAGNVTLDIFHEAELRPSPSNVQQGRLDVRIVMVVDNGAVLALVSLVLLAGACVKHPHTARLVYVPTSSSPAPVEGATSTDAMIIEEPPPPPPPVEPVEINPAPEPATPKPVIRPRRPARTSEPSVAEETAEPQAAPGLPPLEPRGSTEQQKALRDQIAGIQTTTNQRITRLEQLNVSSADLKFLGDARHFLEESQQALTDGDLQRSQNLAHKAALLVDSVEKSH
jgi:hypothetical protein